MEIDQNRWEKAKLWFKRIGIIGFFFFLLKGIVWIVIFIYGVEAIGDCN